MGFSFEMQTTTAQGRPQDRLAIEARQALALELAAQAGRLALGYFKTLRQQDIEQKLNGQDVVSVADREVERFLRSRLRTAFPDDGLLGEEDGLEPGTSGCTWVIDPIDGTSCFVHGLESWCISIALERGGQFIELGIIHVPCSGETFHARAGAGAWLNGVPISVDAVQSLQQGLLGMGVNLRVPPPVASGFLLRLLQAGGMPYRNGSGALMLAYVACGRLIAYHEAHINAWDCLAGLLLVHEAGGWCEAFPGAGRTLLEGGPITAGAPQVRDALLGLIDAAACDERGTMP